MPKIRALPFASSAASCKGSHELQDELTRPVLCNLDLTQICLMLFEFMMNLMAGFRAYEPHATCSALRPFSPFSLSLSLNADQKQ